MFRGPDHMAMIRRAMPALPSFLRQPLTLLENVFYHYSDRVAQMRLSYAIAKALSYQPQRPPIFCMRDRRDYDWQRSVSRAKLPAFL